MRASRMRTAALLSLTATFLLAACADDSPPTGPDAGPDAVQTDGTRDARVDLQEIFQRASPAVLALPHTVFADYDEEHDKLVFGVENAGVNRGIQTAMERLGVPASSYEVKVTEPIEFMASLQSEFRPTRGGIQIHFGGYVCTLGFNVDHDGGRSFITNSHCTDRQGGTEGTTYYQPTSYANGTSIAIEADDPDYFKGRGCPKGRKCRWSDASRAVYQGSINTIGEIARTSGPNNGSLDAIGTFDIAAQDDQSTSFSGTVNKVGRTTGWTQGNVVATCATVNVSGSNISLLCQTLVQGAGQIVGGGDSGSPVFRTTGSYAATLLGILWGGSNSGDLFVFSPLASIEREIGQVTATTDGVVGGGGGGGGDGGGGPNCPPNSNKPACR